VKKEDRIIHLLRNTGALSAREITDKLYDSSKHQSIVFGELQHMETKGIIKKHTASFPYCWSLVDDNISIQLPTVIEEYSVPLPSVIATNKPIKTSASISSSKKIVALISCTGSKRGQEGYSCEARLLYDTSPFFPISLAYASIIADYVYVISAEYHLLELDRVIKWYNKTLDDYSSAEAAAWGNIVTKQISERHDISKSEFVILAGQKYYRPIIKELPHTKLPLRSASGFEKQKTEREALYMCARLHSLFNRLPRFHWDSINKVEFDSGIYIVFENGESYYGMDRIVRVGVSNHDL
jgi:hypothetical protein